MSNNKIKSNKSKLKLGYGGVGVFTLMRKHPINQGAGSRKCRAAEGGGGQARLAECGTLYPTR